MKRKGKKGVLLMLAGALLLIAALSLTVYNVYTDRQAGERSKAMEQTLRQQIQENAEDANTGSKQEDGEESLPVYMKNPSMAMPVCSVDDNDYIGILEIPDLGLRLPIMSEWSYPNLKTAPCRYTGTIYMHNMVIAGHNYESHFGRLKDLQPGASVIFTDADGNQFLYEVVEMEILEPTNIEDMKNSGYDLTLFTCTYSGKTRYTVRCRLVENQPG
jgi:sortase A